jgi:hypothetical protein
MFDDYIKCKECGDYCDPFDCQDGYCISCSIEKD